MKRPTPIDQSVPLDKYKYIMSRTDTKGIIEYGNDYFCEISGYTAEELAGQPHNIIRHPDMPRIVFELMWERLKQGKTLFAVVKNMAKDGRYYWVTTKFEIQRNPLTKEITGYLAYRQAAKPKTVETISRLYETLLEKERTGGTAASKAYLEQHLERRGQTYDAFISEAIESNTALTLFFSAMKKMFGAA